MKLLNLDDLCSLLELLSMIFFKFLKNLKAKHVIQWLPMRCQGYLRRSSQKHSMWSCSEFKETMKGKF